LCKNGKVRKVLPLLLCDDTGLWKGEGKSVEEGERWRRWGTEGQKGLLAGGPHPGQRHLSAGHRRHTGLPALPHGAQPQLARPKTENRPPNPARGAAGRRAQQLRLERSQVRPQQPGAPSQPRRGSQVTVGAAGVGANGHGATQAGTGQRPSVVSTEKTLN